MFETLVEYDPENRIKPLDLKDNPWPLCLAEFLKEHNSINDDPLGDILREEINNGEDRIWKQ